MLCNSSSKTEHRTRLTGILVDGAGELGDGRGHLEALVQDTALALQPHVLGHLNHTADILLGLNIVANAKVLRATLEEGVLVLLLGGLLGGRSGRRSSGLLRLFTINTQHTRQTHTHED